MYNQIIFLVNQLTEKYLPSDIKTLILNDYFISDVNNKIKERLKDVFKNNLPTFNVLMKETGCFISGSFIIKCILGEHWDNSDVDIYVPIIKYKPGSLHDIHLYLELNSFMISNMKMENGRSERYPDIIHPKLRWVRDYEGCGKECCGCCNGSGSNSNFNCPRSRKIQIIGIEMEKGFNEAIEFVEESFDSDAYKNLYHFDGVYIKYLKEVITKTANFKSLQRYHKLF